MAGEGRPAEKTEGATKRSSERTSERTGDKEKEKKAEERASGSGGGSTKTAVPVEKKDKEKAVVADKKKEEKVVVVDKKEKAKPAETVKAKPADTPKAKPAETTRSTRLSGGTGSRAASETLPEEVLTSIAQAKFEAQEDKLKDVARFSVALIRDFPKLSSADATKRIGDVQKALLKYEMHCIRAWEFQERRRRLEIEALEAEAKKCQEEAQKEGEHTVELERVLEKERRRRKRYEGYEALAAEVNAKRTRPDYKARIDSTTEDIATLKQRTADYEALTTERTKRAHLLAGAVAELSADLRKEEELATRVLGASAVEEPKAAAPEVEAVELIS